MEINLRIAELVVAKAPDTIRTILGSCIGLCLWDKNRQIGGMVHIMLPNIKNHSVDDNKAKFADTAVDALLSEMKKKGAHLEDIVASIIGGAAMFSSLGKSQTLNIGNANYEIVKQQLKKNEIPVILEDVGGTAGRQAIFDAGTGKVTVRIFDKSY